MQKGKRGQHSPEFKARVALAATVSDKSLAELSMEYLRCAPGPFGLEKRVGVQRRPVVWQGEAAGGRPAPMKG